jgi:hypothetical protein
MATKNLPLASVGGTGTLMLPQFAAGMLLQSDDLAALGAYSRDLSRLMFRTLFGCGVMCGLKVTVIVNCGKIVINVDAGVALDCCGDPIQVTSPQTITIDPECNPQFPTTLYVVLCEKNKCCAPRPAMCSADNGDSTPVCTREKYGFEIRVVADRPSCACGCPDPDQTKLLDCDCKCVNPERECYVDHYAGKCGCDCCGSDADCTCNCVLLARLTYDSQAAQPWSADHLVRRFVRPVLIEDPQVRIEADKKKQAAAPAAAAAPAPAVAAPAAVAVAAPAVAAPPAPAVPPAPAPAVAAPAAAAVAAPAVAAPPAPAVAPPPAQARRPRKTKSPS